MLFRRTPIDSDDQPADLSALDPDRVGRAPESFVAAVMSRIDAAGLTPAPVDPFVGLWSLGRSVSLTAAAVLLAIALVHVSDRVRPQAPLTVDDALGVPLELRAAPAAPGGGR